MGMYYGGGGGYVLITPLCLRSCDTQSPQAMPLWPHSCALLECLFLLLPPLLCVTYSCAVVDKKDHTTGAIHPYSLPVQREYEALHIMNPSLFLAFLNPFQFESVNVVDPGLFGQVGSGSRIIFQDPDLTFLTRKSV